MAWARFVIAGALLAGPAVLSFFSGAYFDKPRLWAGIVAWLLVGLAALACPRPWPRSGSGRVVVAALAGLLAWTAVSLTWSPVRDAALGDVQRLALYLGALLAGVAVFGERRVARAAEPVLALGAVVAVIEGLSERLLPHFVTLERSASGSGRLLQPLTYWNAMGLLAAIGILLCVRLAGDASRPRALRVSAAAAVPTLAVAGYLTLSRGAILAVVVGLATLALLQPVHSQVRAMCVAVLTAAPAVLVAAVLPAIRTMEGSTAARDRAGVLLIAVLLGAGLAAAIASARDRPSTAPLRRRGVRAVRWAAVLTAAGVVVVFGVLASQRQETVSSSTLDNTRLLSSESIRGDFWRVARGAFADEPLRGVGSGGFAVEWLRERPVVYSARDAHSLYFETAAELGIVGLVLLGGFMGGVAVSGRRAYRRDPILVAGPLAVLATCAAHAGLDWDWEMPAVALIAILMAALTIATSDEEEPAVVVERTTEVGEATAAPRPSEVTL